MPTPRPLSPHLQIYRLTLTMVVSGVHRLSGLALSAGAFVAVLWLIALGRGPAAYGDLVRALRSAPGLLIVAALIVSFWFHLSSGIRHLIWDTGHALERREARRGAALVVLAALLGSALTLVVVAHRMWGGA